MVDLEVALEGTRVGVGETIHCSGEGCDGRFHEGAPVTIVARTRSGGWDVKRVFGPHCAPDELRRVQACDSEGVAGAEGELAVVFSDEQAWLVLVRLGVLSSDSAVEGLLGLPSTLIYKCALRSLGQGA